MKSSEVRPAAPPAVPHDVRLVIDECVAAFGDNLRTVLWHGSGARGEATASSDTDLVFLFDQVDDTVLLTLKDVFRQRRPWSSLIFSREEFSQLPPDHSLQFAHGFQVVHGAFEPLRPGRQEILAELRALAEEIAFQCRYRFIHKHGDWPRQVRMMWYMAKSATLAMKARHLLACGVYPETRAALRPVIDDPREQQIITWIERWEEYRPGFEADPVPLMLHLDGFSRRLVSWLARIEAEG